MYSAVSVLACVALIIIISITQATFNPESFTQLSYWVSFSIQCAICIYGMIAGQQTGDDVSRNKPDGQFRMCLKRYSEIFSMIDADHYFTYIEDWLEQFRALKLKRKIHEVLLDNGIHQEEVLDLDLSELDSLRKPGFYKDWTFTDKRAKYFNDNTQRSETYFVSYSDEQIAIIRGCICGKVKVSKLPRSFFVNAFSESEKDMWESAARAENKKSLYLGSSYIYKIGALFATSVLTTGLETGISGGASQATVWLTMINRLFTLTMAIVWGTYIGMQIVKIDAEYLDFKISVLKEYYDDYKQGVYKPMTIEERAKEQFLESQKKQHDLPLAIRKDKGKEDAHA